jgi:hypothetical protein
MEKNSYTLNEYDLCLIELKVSNKLGGSYESKKEKRSK